MFVTAILPVCLLVAIATVGAGDVEVGNVLQQQHGTLRMLLNIYSHRIARAAIAPGDANKCFNNYMTEESTVISTYNRDFLACSNSSEAKKKAFQQEIMQYRDDLIKRGEAICVQMEACKKPTDDMEFFNCYNSMATSSYEVLYGIAKDSDSHSTDMQSKYANIENEYKTCVGTAHNNYLNDIYNCNKALQNCLSGQNVDTTTAVSDSTSESDSSSEPGNTDSSSETGTESDSTSAPTSLEGITTLIPEMTAIENRKPEENLS